LVSCFNKDCVELGVDLFYDLLGSAAGADDGGSAGGDAGAGGGADGGSSGGDSGSGGSGDIAGGADPDWYTQLSADAQGEEASLRDWVKATGVKDLDGLAKVARDNQRALRESGRVKVPGEGASAEEITAFHKAIGVPDDAKGYAFTPPKDAQGNDVPLDQKGLERIAAAAHQHGVPKAAMEAVVAEFIKGQMDDLADAESQVVAAVEAKLKGFGADRAAKIAAMDNAIKALDLTAEQARGIRGVLGGEKAIDVFVRLGEGMSEDKLITGGSGKFGVSGEQAKAELNELKKDRSWVDKAMTKGTPENARYERLNNAIGADADQKARLNATA